MCQCHEDAQRTVHLGNPDQPPETSWASPPALNSSSARTHGVISYYTYCQTMVSPFLKRLSWEQYEDIGSVCKYQVSLHYRPTQTSDTLIQNLPAKV